jgi:hypothetical protein
MVPECLKQQVRVTAGWRCVGGQARIHRVLRCAAALTHATADRLQALLPDEQVNPEVQA